MMNKCVERIKAEYDARWDAIIKEEVLAWLSCDGRLVNNCWISHNNNSQHHRIEEGDRPNGTANEGTRAFYEY